MSFIEIDGKRHPVPPGESAIGSDSDGFIELQGGGITPRHLVIQGTADGQAAVRRADEDAETYINGVRLGPQPTPLLHGDKIELGGYELLFVDERRSGSTQFVSAEELANYRPEGAKTAASRPTGATGGRLVSLTDGREYAIVGPTLVFGREAGCDVVVTSKRVSRRHAEIKSTASGYVLVDTSTNGTFVNGDRVDGDRLLKRADVLRVGDDEFRFYADDAGPAIPDEGATPSEPGASSPSDPAAMPQGAESMLRNTIHGIPGTTPPVPDAPTPALGAEFRLGNTMHGIPEELATPAPTTPPEAEPAKDSGPPTGAEYRLGNTMHGLPGEMGGPTSGPADRDHGDGPPTGAEYRLGNTMHGIRGVGGVGGPSVVDPTPASTLAHFVGRSGEFKGRRFEIKVPIVNVGRANYNDIVIEDATVSTIHAKLQRREGIWTLVDLDSTNGTFVDGERLSGEAPIAPGAIVRFGDVSTVFEPTDDGIDAPEGGSTRLVSGVEPGAGPGGPSGHGGTPGSNAGGRAGEGKSESTPDQGQGRSGFRLWPFK